MATTMCEIDGRRPVVATVRIRQNGIEKGAAEAVEEVDEPDAQPAHV